VDFFSALPRLPSAAEPLTPPRWLFGSAAGRPADGPAPPGDVLGLIRSVVAGGAARPWARPGPARPGPARGLGGSSLGGGRLRGLPTSGGRAPPTQCSPSWVCRRSVPFSSCARSRLAAGVGLHAGQRRAARWGPWCARGGGGAAPTWLPPPHSSPPSLCSAWCTDRDLVRVVGLVAGRSRGVWPVNLAHLNGCG